MSIHLHLSGQTESIFRAEAETMGISASALAKAVLATAAEENTIPTLVAGVDLEFFQEQLAKRSGRYPVHSFRGRKMSLAKIAEEVGISKYTIKARLDSGWTMERATSTPVAKRGRV